MLSAQREPKAAKRVFHKVLRARQNQKSRVINMEKNAAYPSAFEDRKQEKLVEEECELRPVKYLNKRVEEDHRARKRITRAGLGYQSFHTAGRTRARN